MNTKELNIKCLICGKSFKHLGSHIAKGHKILCRDYKKEFGLDYNFPLISADVKKKKQDKFNERREYYLKNFKKEGKKWQFKKGHTNRQRFSKMSIERARQNLAWIDTHKAGTCPICRMTFEHLASHLYNAHGLIEARK